MDLFLEGQRVAKNPPCMSLSDWPELPTWFCDQIVV